MFDDQNTTAGSAKEPEDIFAPSNLPGVTTTPSSVPNPPMNSGIPNPPSPSAMPTPPIPGTPPSPPVAPAPISPVINVPTPVTAPAPHPVPPSVAPAPVTPSAIQALPVYGEKKSSGAFKIIAIFFIALLIIVAAAFLAFRIIVGPSLLGDDEITVIEDGADIEAVEEQVDELFVVPEEEIVEEIDTDGDGLTDAEEIQAGTSTTKTDTDDDGLGDREEVQVYGTDPLDADTDGDGYLDGGEVAGGFNPNGEGRLFAVPK